MHKLTGNKLVSYKLVEQSVPVYVPDELDEKLKRPKTLKGSTYKIKPNVEDASSMYITINDIVLNEGTEFEEIRPFEIFINSKNVEHVQWVSALTRVMSAVFRKGGDCTFLVEELGEVFDPRGGYWYGSRLMDSIVAHIGVVLEDHMKSIGMLDDGMSTEQKTLIASKAQTFAELETETQSTGFPKNAQVCKKCNHKAAILMDNCLTCLNCGDGKCG
jgi:hypothetical protein